jgi:hypothetical protein
MRERFVRRVAAHRDVSGFLDQSAKLAVVDVLS